ncbi:MAG: hypothetical protein PVF65_01005 [Sphingomonadales bacterium]|jgi:hypothetical protein
MTRATQISLVYLAYAAIAAVGILPLTSSNGFGVLAGIMAPDIISMCYRNKGEHRLVLPDHILYIIGGMALGLSILLPQVSTPIILFLFAVSARIWVALHTESGVQFALSGAAPKHGRLKISLTKPRELALRWICCCLTITLIADTIVPRSMHQGFALIAELHKQGLI